MPMLNGTTGPAPAGAHGFDCTCVVSANAAAAMKQAGFEFCVRYLSRLSPQGGGDLTHEEASAILESGLALMAVQHVPRAGWIPDGQLGQEYGQAAVQNAQSVGLPGGMILWLDLEGVRQGVGSDDVIQYCNTWFSQVQSANYIPGVYVGDNCILTGDDLFWKLKTRHYWRAGSNVPDISVRGYQLIQHISPRPDRLNGLDIDRDITMTDKLGGAVVWLAPNR